MINYDPAMIAEIQKEVAAGFWLVSIGLSTTLYYTDADIPLARSSHLYQPRDLRIQGIESTANFSVDAAKLDLDDVDRQVSAAFLNEDPAAKEIIISYTLVNAVGQEIATAVITRGMILGWDASETRVSISIASEFVYWRKQSLRLPTPNCPWAFKGTECTYAGAETFCDQTPERCAALGNYLNFGGRKYIAEMEDVRIYWGPAGT